MNRPLIVSSAISARARHVGAHVDDRLARDHRRKPRHAVHSDGAKASPSSRNRVPNLASQMRVAFSSIASNTGSVRRASWR